MAKGGSEKGADLGSDREDLHNLLQSVWHRSDDHQSVQQVHGDTVRCDDLRTTHSAHAPVRCKDDDGGQRRLKSTVEVRKALDVEHVHLRH